MGADYSEVGLPQAMTLRQALFQSDKCRGKAAIKSRGTNVAIKRKRNHMAIKSYVAYNTRFVTNEA